MRQSETTIKRITGNILHIRQVNISQRSASEKGLRTDLPNVVREGKGRDSRVFFERRVRDSSRLRRVGRGEDERGTNNLIFEVGAAGRSGKGCACYPDKQGSKQEDFTISYL